MQDFLKDIAHIWWSSMVVDLRRYAIFSLAVWPSGRLAVWLVLWVVLRVPLRTRKIRQATPPARQLIVELLYSLRSVAVFSTVGIGIALLSRAGFYPLSNLSQHWGPVWFGVSLVLMIIGQDAWIYFTHRWMHRPRWFRRFHRRHHLSNNPSPFTAYSFDLGEAVLMVIFVLTWPLVIPTPWPVVGLFMLHQIFRNTLLHAGYELTPARADGRPWLDFITTTTHHDLHHAQASYNFAPWFTWWDRWLGTQHPEYLARYAATARRPLRASAQAAPGLLEA